MLKQVVLTKKECGACEEERRSRHIVMNSPGDERHKNDNVLFALAILPNNDIKYEANKTRAQIFAKQTAQAITWPIAKDRPSNKVIAET